MSLLFDFLLFLSDESSMWDMMLSRKSSVELFDTIDSSALSDVSKNSFEISLSEFFPFSFRLSSSFFSSSSSPKLLPLKIKFPLDLSVSIFD